MPMSRSWRASGRWKKSFSLPNESSRVSRQEACVGRRLCRDSLSTGMVGGRRLRACGSKRGPSRRAGLRCFGTRISSALVANRIYSETMAQIERSAELGAMLRSLNHFVVENLATSSFFFTVAAVRLDRSCRSLPIRGAGHPPAMIARRGELPRLLESRSGILGLFENVVDVRQPSKQPSNREIVC